jgi:hypothetical protein
VDVKSASRATADEKELWVVDGANNFVHIFDATAMPPKQGW